MIKALIDQGMINEDSIIIDHNVKKSNDFKNYVFLGNNLFKKLFFFFKFRIIYKSFIKKNKINSLLSPHSYGILANFLIKQNISNKILNIELYHEGILSLYNENENPKKVPFKKIIISLLILHKFDYKSDLFPINYASKFYSPFSKNSSHIPLNKIFNFKLPNHKFNSLEKHTALIIGQPNYYGDYTEFNDNRLFKKALINILRENKINKCLYKPHPVEKKYIINKNDVSNLQVIDKSIAIETISKKLSPKIVISGFSSSLIHFKICNPDVDFYTITPKKSIIYSRKSIIKVFNDYGIKIIII